MLTDLSVGSNLLNGVGAFAALPPSLIKLTLRDNRLGGIPLAVLQGLPALQVGAQVDKGWHGRGCGNGG